MAPLSDYVTGTITLTNGSVDFTGDGTGWLAAGFREGDTIIDVEGQTEFWAVVAEITDNGEGTLTQPWAGASGTYTYRMRYMADGQRVTAQARTLIELLGNGNLQALAGLTGSANTFPMFTGSGAMIEVSRSELISGADYNVQVNTLDDRDAYDGEPVGFTVLVSDVGDGRSALYSRIESGGWSDPAYLTGPPGASGEPLIAIVQEATGIIPGTYPITRRQFAEASFVRFYAELLIGTGSVVIYLERNGVVVSEPISVAFGTPIDDDTFALTLDEGDQLNAIVAGAANAVYLVIQIEGA